LMLGRPARVVEEGWWWWWRRHLELEIASKLRCPPLRSTWQREGWMKDDGPWKAWVWVLGACQ